MDLCLTNQMRLSIVFIRQRPTTLDFIFSQRRENPRLIFRLISCTRDYEKVHVHATKKYVRFFSEIENDNGVRKPYIYV